MPPRKRDEELKELYKEALKEWLDEKFAAFGRWSAYTLAAMVLTGIVYFILWANGWHKGGM